MGPRLITAAVSASLLAASCSGCFTDDKATQKTARITVDKNTRTSHAVTCSQVEPVVDGEHQRRAGDCSRDAQAGLGNAQG